MRTQALIGLALLAAVIVGCVGFTPDDAYIYQRYARNLAHGDGVAFNPGTRAEGVTSLAWMAMLAPAAGSPWEGAGLRVAKALGIVLTLAAVGIVALSCGSNAAALMLLFPWLGLHAVSGMETAAALCASAVALACYTGGAASALPWACSIAVLFRPELALPAGILGAALVARAWRRGPGITEYAWAVGFGVPVLGYWIWRSFYFHELLPLPVLAKWNGAPLMAYGLRYAVPLLPWAAWLAWRWLDTWRPDHRRWAVNVGLGLAVLAALSAADGAERYMRMTDANRALGSVLAATAWTSPAPRIALSDVGLIPYLSGLPTTDLLGLTDARMAHGAPLEVAFAEQPAVVVGISSRADSFYPRLEREIGLAVLARISDYSESAVFRASDDYFLHAYYNPSTPDGAAFQAAVLAYIEDARRAGIE